MDVASAILVLQLQVRDNEDVLAVGSNSQDDFHAALKLHLIDLRERLQTLQDHSLAYRPIGASGQETLDGVFGTYHTPSSTQQQLEPELPSPDHPRHRPEGRKVVDLENLPDIQLPVTQRSDTQRSDTQLSDAQLLDTHLPDTQQSDTQQLGTRLSIGSYVSTTIATLKPKRKADDLPDLEQSDDLKRRKIDEDEQHDGLHAVDLASQKTATVETTNGSGTNPDGTFNAESDPHLDASVETVQDETEAHVISQPPPKLPCIACLAVFTERSLIKCPCDHNFCAQCLTEHVKASIQSTAFPPRCCYEEIPYDLFQPHLSVILQASYTRKKNAIDSPGTIHCALLSCQALIASQNISNGRATCLCKTITCVVCKFVAHDDACPEDAERTALLRLAVSRGLRACYRCGELYERDFGCNHMSCTKCSAEFCYNCGRKWRTCNCGYVENQARQLIRTGEVVDNRTVAAPAPVIAHRPVRRPARAVCYHDGGWDKVLHPDAECKDCGYDSGYFLLQCHFCHAWSCVNCLDGEDNYDYYGDY